MVFLIVVLLLFVIIGVLGHFIKKKKMEEAKNRTDEVDGELKFDDILSFFRSMKLQKDVDCPFLANGSCEQLRTAIDNTLYPPREGYKMIVIGVYNETDNVFKDFRVVYAKGLDERVTELLKEKDLVILN